MARSYKNAKHLGVTDSRGDRNGKVVEGLQLSRLDLGSGGTETRVYRRHPCEMWGSRRRPGFAARVRAGANRGARGSRACGWRRDVGGMARIAGSV
jgi:hypothetical protein